MLVGGEPGIGKSRLAEEIAARARAAARACSSGAAGRRAARPAYWPWMQALRACVAERDAPALRAQLGAGGGELAQILPELATRLPDLPAPAAPDAEGARFRLFEAVARLLGRGARPARSSSCSTTSTPPTRLAAAAALRRAGRSAPRRC